MSENLITPEKLRKAKDIHELAEKILALVEYDTNAGCWLWPRSVNARGYGQISFNMACKKTHRVVFEALKEAIPHDMVVCHKCDVPACCNPSHLFLGTQSDNIKDCAAKGRHKEQVHGKIGVEQAKSILFAVRRGDVLNRVAEQYNVHPATVQRIAKGAHRHSKTIDEIFGYIAKQSQP